MEEEEGEEEREEAAMRRSQRKRSPTTQRKWAVGGQGGGGAGVWTMTPLADAVEKIDKVGSCTSLGGAIRGGQRICREHVCARRRRFRGGGGDSQRTIFHVPGGHEIPMPLRRDKALEDAPMPSSTSSQRRRLESSLLRPSDNKVTPPTASILCSWTANIPRGAAGACLTLFY